MNKQYKIEDRDIVVISLQPWYYEYGSNCRNIALHLAKNNRVLYVNLPINRKTYLSKVKDGGISDHCDIIRNEGERIKRVSKSLWTYYPGSVIESINWLPSTSTFKSINYLNNRRFAKDISFALDRLNFSDIILFNDNDIYNGFYLKEMLSPSFYIYYMRDFLQGYDYWKRHASALEPELIKKADAVVTNSTWFTEYCSNYNLNSHYIGQGCNTDVFDANKNYVIPDDLKQFSSPLIGYVGAINSERLDETIIEKIALAHPEWNVILVGPEDDFFKAGRLHNISNILFTGAKRMEELPQYINAFDVCINPQFNNEITKGNYPLKIDEYLALGKPVVCTRTVTMKLFEPYTYLADEPPEYIRLIEKALSEDCEGRRQKRIAFARSHTWENSMNALQKAVFERMGAKEKTAVIA